MIFEDERAAPAERVGFVLHLGDFIYEVLERHVDRGLSAKFRTKASSRGFDDQSDVSIERGLRGREDRREGRGCRQCSSDPRAAHAMPSGVPRVFTVASTRPDVRSTIAAVFASGLVT